MWEVCEDSLATLKANLNVYDTGFWSLYEQSGTRLPMVASPFYHRLHIVQLRVMAKLTGDEFFPGVRRSLGGIYAEPHESHPRAVLQERIQALLLLR